MGEGARSVTRQASAGVAAGGESKGRGGARECLPVNARPHKARKVGAEMKGANAPLIAQSACNAGDPGAVLGGKIPWRRDRLRPPVLWPGESHGLYSARGHRVGHD